MKGIHHKGMKYSHIYMYSGQVKLGALCVNGILWLVAKKRKRKKNQNNPDQNQAKREQRGLAELFAQSVLIISSD